MKTLAIIIYSRDRAMQLHACIASLKKYCIDFSYPDIFVLYRVENEYEHQYEILKKEFPEISFISETNLPKQTHDIILEYDAVSIMADDNLFYNLFHLEFCINCFFDDPKVLGFSLRLGKNINRSQIMDIEIKHPSWVEFNASCLFFGWHKQQRDFGYPMEVSSSIYKTEDVNSFLKNIKSGIPATIESYMSKYKGPFVKTKPYLMCLKTSVVFSVPVNIVRGTSPCRYGEKYPATIKELAVLFDEGKRIDITKIPKEINACHTEVKYEYTF